MPCLCVERLPAPHCLPGSAHAPCCVYTWCWSSSTYAHLPSFHHDHHQPKKKATHPAFGQYGLFAAVPLPPRSWVVDYIGRVTDSVHCSKTSDYTMSLGAAGMCVSVYSWWWCQQCSSCLFSVCSNEYTVIFFSFFLFGGRGQAGGSFGACSCQLHELPGVGGIQVS